MTIFAMRSVKSGSWRISDMDLVWIILGTVIMTWIIVPAVVCSIVAWIVAWKERKNND